MLAGKKMPGALGAEALGYFRHIARTKAAPVLPPYEGVFSRKPTEKMLYEAKPKENYAARANTAACPRAQPTRSS